jgi:glycosyltransferase involved in cell wall biosynthesis
MKILFLPSYFYPEQAASSYLGDNLRSALINKGHQVEVHTPRPSRGINKELRGKYKAITYQESDEGLMKVHRFPMINENKSPILRAFRYFLCHFLHFYYGIKSKNIDLLFIASTPPTQGVLGVFFKKTKKIPLVYNLQDIFPDSLVATGLTRKGSLLWKIGRTIENFTYSNADKIIVISEGFKKNIMEKGVPESKIEVIYNWVDENEVIAVERNSNILFERYNLDKNKFYVTYNGNIGLTQNMDLLLDVAEMFRDNPAIQFVIMGEGVYKKEVEHKLTTQKVENVTLLPFQPYKEISHVFSLGDVGLVISKENVGQNSVPSKTWSIMSAARPVLASFDENSELQEIIEKNKTGLFVKAGEKEALYKAILELYNNPQQRKEMGQNGRAFILKNLTREIGTSKYVEVIKSVVQEHQSKV